MIPNTKQAYSPSIGIGTIPTYIFKTFDPTSLDIEFDLYSVWINTVTKGIWYMEALSASNGNISATWRAVAPIVVSSTGPSTPLTSSSDYAYPLGQTWVDSTANDYYVMVSNPTDTTGYWIKLSAGTQGVDLFAMQTGTSPIGPDTDGIVTFNGGTVVAGTNPVRTNGTASNTMELQVQISQALASADATKIGLSNFDSASFAVDANGFVTLTGSGNFVWSDVSGAFSPLKNNGYFITGTATGTLPASPSDGDTIRFFVDTSQILTIQATGTQIIRVANTVSAAAGTCVSTLQGDSIELVYRATDTCWCAMNSPSGIWNVT